MKDFIKPLFPVMPLYHMVYKQNPKTKQNYRTMRLVGKSRCFYEDMPNFVPETEMPCVNHIRVVFFQKDPLLQKGVFIHYMGQWFMIKKISKVNNMPDIILCYLQWLPRLG